MYHIEECPECGGSGELAEVEEKDLIYDCQDCGCIFVFVEGDDFVIVQPGAFSPDSEDSPRPI